MQESCISVAESRGAQYVSDQFMLAETRPLVYRVANESDRPGRNSRRESGVKCKPLGRICRKWDAHELYKIIVSKDQVDELRSVGARSVQRAKAPGAEDLLWVLRK
jgi:hypothetical protein